MAIIVNKAAVLVQHLRNNLVEEEHSGFIVRVSLDEGVVERIGVDEDYPFYLRSCAKPLQASVIVDYDLDFTVEETALCCGSNAGEKIHYDTAFALAKKIGIKESDLKCGIHKPLSKTRQQEMFLSGKKENQFYNNCVGKHLMMLALCKKLGYEIKNYEELEHPVQQIIIKKVKDLCEVQQEYPITKDGCGVPILSMPLKNIVTGFLNLFCNEKYQKLTSAILENPYIYGGEDRTDTKIIQKTGLISKVGAGGLCVVINKNKKEGFIVKISDCDMKTREIVAFEYIKKLAWGNFEPDKLIRTLHNEIVGEIECLL